MKPFVIIESPFAGEVEKNIEYARQCLRDSILRGEVPFASHLLYTQEGVLDDTDPHERELGINLGLETSRIATLTAVYTDRGISSGMRYGIQRAKDDGREVEFRSLYDNSSQTNSGNS